MKKWVKKFAFLLSLVLLLSTSQVNVYANNQAARSNETISIGINAINTSLHEGQSLLLTPAYGETIVSQNNHYGWCRVATFDWSEKEDAYVLVTLDRTLGNDMNKKAVIPPNGFAIVTFPSYNPTYSNTISSTAFDKIEKLTIGTKVYLEGIDLKAGTFEYEGNLDECYSPSFVTKGYVKVCLEKPEGCYEPNKDKLLDAPVFTDMKELYAVNEIQGEIKIAWKPVKEANEYYAALFKSTMNTTGDSIISGKTTENSISLRADGLRAGTSYTAFVYAIGDDGSSSPMAQYTFMIGSERAMNRPFADKKIVAFGDSITDYKGWVDMLYGELGCQVVNAGVAGDRTSQALARIDKDVIAENPDLVIINLGMNDQAYNTSTKKNLTPIDQYEANYRTIIDKILATGSDIILVAVHDVSTKQYGGGSPVYNEKDETGVTYVDKYNEVVKRLAEEYQIGFLDMNTITEDALQFITVDGIHLNEAGQVKYFQAIADYCYEYAAPDSIDGNEDGKATLKTIFTVGVSLTVAAVVILTALVLMKNKKKHR